jgi:hypothetical protein
MSLSASRCEPKTSRTQSSSADFYPETFGLLLIFLNSAAVQRESVVSVTFINVILHKTHGFRNFL